MNPLRDAPRRCTMTEEDRLAAIDTGRQLGRLYIKTLGLEAAQEHLARLGLGDAIDAALFVGFGEVITAEQRRIAAPIYY